MAALQNGRAGGKLLPPEVWACWEEGAMAKKLRVGVLASGGGTNLQTIIDNCASGKLDAEVVVVISDVQCGALERARKAGIAAEHIDRRDKERFPTREEFDRAVLACLRRQEAELVCLAGYLRIMTPELVEAYEGRMINIHPALLPSFGGKGMVGHHVHQAVLDYGCKVSGATVHFVTLGTDEGPIILQRPVPVEEGDTPETLAARILPHEHELYSEAIQLFAEGRLKIELYSEAIQLFAEGRLKIEGRRVRILPRKA
jgi:phosphoribosylglycinamide formyltransferase-1